MFKPGLLIHVLLFSTYLLFGQNWTQKEVSIYYYDNIEPTSFIFTDDSVWNKLERHEILSNFNNETPTLSSTYWKAAWDEKGLYVFVYAIDDEWHPSWDTGLEESESDRVELYIDVTIPQRDGGGAKDGNGNYIIAPYFLEWWPTVGFPQYTSEFFEYGSGIYFNNFFDLEGTYTLECFIPFTAISTNNGDTINPYTTPYIGFDIVLRDCDSYDISSKTTNRLVWSNTGELGDCWENCDQVGIIYFDTTDYLAVDIPNKISIDHVLKSNVIHDMVFLNIEPKLISVFNPSGKRLIHKATNERQISLSMLNAGIYVIKITGADNQPYSEKFIKL